MITPKLHPVVKDQWLKALRSGDYKQGRRMLRSGKDEYCCLGVLCDLHSKDTWYPAEEGNWGHLDPSRTGLPSNQVLRWSCAGEPVETLFVNGGDAQKYVTMTLDQSPYGLAALNDAGATFEEIANVIENLL